MGERNAHTIYSPEIGAPSRPSFAETNGEKTVVNPRCMFNSRCSLFARVWMWPCGRVQLCRSVSKDKNTNNDINVVGLRYFEFILRYMVFCLTAERNKVSRMVVARGCPSVFCFDSFPWDNQILSRCTACTPCYERTTERDIFMAFRKTKKKPTKSARLMKVFERLGACSEYYGRWYPYACAVHLFSLLCNARGRKLRGTL